MPSTNPFTNNHPGPYRWTKRYGLSSNAPDYLNSIVREQIQLVSEPKFPCPGAKMLFMTDAGVASFTTLPATHEGVSQLALDSLLYAVCQFGVDEDLKSLPSNKNDKLTAVGISFETQFTTEAQAQHFFGTLIRQINEKDAEFFEVAEGYSRNTMDPNFILSVAGIPYFVNINYDSKKQFLLGRYSKFPLLFLVPQEHFENQKCTFEGKNRATKAKAESKGINEMESEFVRMSTQVRRSLESYGVKHPALSAGIQQSSAPGFMLTDINDEEAILAASEALGKNNVSWYRKLLITSTSIAEKSLREECTLFSPETSVFGCPAHTQFQDSIKDDN